MSEKTTAPEGYALSAWSAEAIDQLEARIWRVENQMIEDENCQFRISNLNVTVPKGGGKKNKDYYIPMGVPDVLGDHYQTIARLVGTVRRRDRYIAALEKEVEGWILDRDVDADVPAFLAKLRKKAENGDTEGREDG